MKADLTVSILRDMAELERLRGEWEALLGRASGLHPSLTPTWLLTWWRVFGPSDDRRLRTLAVRDGRELVGLLPLLERRHVYHGLVPMRRLELLASGERHEDEIFSEYLGPIAAAGREDDVARALAGSLDAQRGIWEELVLPALEGDSPAVAAFDAALRAQGFACERTISGQCPYVALPERWDDYLAALSSDDRYMAKRSLRDFEKWAGPSGEVEVARTHEDLQRGRDILHRLHETRWQAGGQDGVFASPVFRRFHDMVMPALLDRGELDLRWLMAKGEPVAVSYSVVDDGRVYFYQSGRATEVPRGVRPGIVLHLYAIKAAIEAGRKEYDFLAGDQRYKTQLSTATRPLVALRVTRPSIAEAARAEVVKGRALLVQARDRAREEWAKRRRPPAGGSALKKATPRAGGAEDLAG
jgi:CelD/BcsL family acetyltransferase involved in cellulose biosynthesis